MLATSGSLVGGVDGVAAEELEAFAFLRKYERMELLLLDEAWKPRRLLIVECGTKVFGT